MMPQIYDVNREVSRRAESIEDLLEGEDGRWMLSPRTDFPAGYDELVIPDDSCIARDYFWLPSEISEVNIYKISNTIYTSKACLYKNKLAVGGGNVLAEYPLADAQASIADAFQLPSYLPSGFVILHANFTTYGHFMLEMIPKIVAYKALLAARPDLKLVLPGNVPKFVLSWLSLLVSEESIVFAPPETNVVIGETYLSDMLSTHYAFSDCLAGFLKLCQERAFEVLQRKQFAGGYPAKIFLSRSNRRSERPDFRVLENEDRIATRMIELGFTVVCPEEQPIEIQIGMFGAARIVVGELSSAIHNCIFSESGAVVVQLNPFNPVQRRIAASRGHKLVSVLSDDNRIYGWPQSATARFTVSVERIEHALSAESVGQEAHYTLRG